MKKIFVLFLSMFFCFMLLLGLYGEAKKQTDYFPLAVGNFWKYDIAGTKDKLLIKVSRTAKVENKECYKIETYVNNEPVLIEYMYKSGNDILQNKLVVLKHDGFSAIILKPSKKIITNSLKAGDCWVYKGADYGCANSMQTKKAVKEEFVQTPAGKFKAMRVTTSIVGNGKKLEKVTWYAAGIGPIKSVTSTGSVILTGYKVKTKDYK